jgi:hypothetical protein
MPGIFKRLSANDIKITPFEAHKQYETTDLSSIGASTASLAWSNKNKSEFSTGSRQYYQLDKLYYRNYIQERAYRLELDDATYTTQERRLYQSASLLSLSQKTFGSEVQPKSLTLKVSKSGADTGIYNIADDGFGNLYDTDKEFISGFPNEDYRIFYLGPTQGFKREDLTLDYETGNPYVNNPFSRGYTNIVYDDSYFLNQVKFKNVRFSASDNSGFSSIKTSYNAQSEFLPTTNSLNRHNLKSLYNEGELTVVLGENTTEFAGSPASGGPEKLFVDINPGNAAAAFAIDDDTGNEIESFSVNFNPAIQTSEIATRLNVKYLEMGDAVEFQVNNDPSTRSEPGYSAASATNQTYSSSFSNFGDELHSIQYFFSHSAIANGYFMCTNLELDISDSIPNSYIKIPHQSEFNFETDDEFAINFYYDLTPSDHINSTRDGDYFILTKEGTKSVPILPSETTQHTPLSRTGSAKMGTAPAGNQFPYRIYYKGNYPSEHSASLFFERSDGDNTQVVSASFFIANETDRPTNRFISCKAEQVSGVYSLVLQVDSDRQTSVDQGSLSLNKTVSNKADITLYNKPNPDGSYSNFIGYGGGQISQLMIWNTGVSSPQTTYISESIIGTPNIGNIFYDNGFAALTHPKYMSILDSGNTIETLKYKNTHLITENEYQCTMTEDEFEFTTNNSIRKIPFSDSEDIANFATGSQFKPYVTSVGLYDDSGNLLVIGKLGQPIKASSETDTTFVIRFDT